jgi:prophage regulatory protein
MCSLLHFRYREQKFSCSAATRLTLTLAEKSSWSALPIHGHWEIGAPIRKLARSAKTIGRVNAERFGPMVDPNIPVAAPEEPRARRMRNEKQVLAMILRVSHTTLWRMVTKGQFPKPTFVSPNRCFWFEDVILAWQNEIEGQDRGAARLKA